MTRSSKLALVTLLAGLLSLASVASVSAYEPCDGQAENRCAVISAADEAIVYHIEAASPTHILSGNGTGQEHFEQMATTSDRAALFLLPGTPHVLNALGIGQEHFAAMMAQASNP